MKKLKGQYRQWYIDHKEPIFIFLGGVALVGWFFAINWLGTLCGIAVNDYL